MLVFRSKILVIRGLLLCLPVMLIQFTPVNGAENAYYSIHLASFKNLQNANKHVNSLKKKGKMVFWKETDIPEKGLFYRVYLGKYENRSDALEFWNKLKEEGVVSYRGIHRFTEESKPFRIVKPPRKETYPKTMVAAKPDTVPAIHTTKKKDRFLDNRDGTVTDTITNLMWIKNGWRLDFVSALSWGDAMKKCEGFRHGGYSDWRLPTVQEWKSVLDTGKECPALVEPNPFENIIVHMPYWTRTEFVYGSEHTCTTECPVHAYIVMLYYGKINHQKKNKRAFVLPVRSVE